MVYGPDEPVADFVAKLIPGCERGFDRPRAFGILEDNQLIAGVVYTNWNPEAGIIEMSAAATSPRWFTGKVIRTVFSYPFDLCACQMVVLRVSEKNQRMRSIAERLGFTGYPIPRLRGRDESEIVYTLTEEQWRASRFERSRHGQQA